MSQQTNASSANNEPTIDTECTQIIHDCANQDDDADPLQEIRRLFVASFSFICPTTYSNRVTDWASTTWSVRSRTSEPISSSCSSVVSVEK